MKKHIILGYIAYYCTKLLRFTLRKKIILPKGYQKDKPYLCAFWHGKQFLPVLELGFHQTPCVILVSPSKDGDILSLWLRKLGFEVIRGSSRKDNIRALATMMRKLKQGYSCGFAIDGPLGPIYQAKPGMSHLARKFNLPIVPIGTACSRKWIFHKAWDKFELPKPFSTFSLYMGEPFVLDEHTSLEDLSKKIEEQIWDAEHHAAQALESS